MRLHQAQVESMAPIDLVSCLVSDELTRRSDRLLERRRKQAQFRDPQKNLDNFDFTFNPKMNRSLVFDLATAAFIARHEDSLFVGPPGSGTSHRASRHPTRLSCALSRDSHLARGTRRSLDRRYAQTAHRVPGHCTLADPR